MVERIPLVGGSIVRAVENHLPSRREREQADLIATLQDEIIGHREQIGELEYRLEEATKPETGSAMYRRLAQEDATRRSRDRAGKSHGSR